MEAGINRVGRHVSIVLLIELHHLATDVLRDLIHIENGRVGVQTGCVQLVRLTYCDFSQFAEVLLAQSRFYLFNILLRRIVFAAILEQIRRHLA